MKAGKTVIAKVVKRFDMSKRMLLIVSPFLTIVAVLVWLAIVSMDILTAGRAYVEGESLWSKNQKEAVFHLLRFAADRLRIRIFSAIGKRSWCRWDSARLDLELEKPHPDYAVVTGRIP